MQSGVYAPIASEAKLSYTEGGRLLAGPEMAVIMSRRSSVSAVALFLGLLLGAASFLRAQVVGGLEGTVKDFEGKPLVGVTIVFERQDIKMRFEVKTDKNGRYLHATLPAGRRTRYTVRVVQNGKTLYTRNDVNVPWGEVNRLDIDLQEERKRQSTGEGLTEEQRKQLEEMRKAQEKAESMKEHFNLGVEYMRQKQYTEAVAQFTTAAELDPMQYAIYANLARAYAATNQNEQAIEAYEKAIELKPDEAGYYNNLGAVYAKLGRVEDARQAFETAAELSPEDAGRFYYNLGVTFYNTNQLKAAIEPLRKATEIDPNRAEAFYWLGVCLFGTAEYKREGDEVKSLYPPRTRESFEKYLALAPKGQFADQAKAYLQAIEQTVPAVVRVKKKRKGKK